MPLSLPGTQAPSGSGLGHVPASRALAELMRASESGNPDRHERINQDHPTCMAFVRFRPRGPGRMVPVQAESTTQTKWHWGLPTRIAETARDADWNRCAIKTSGDVTMVVYFGTSLA